MSGRPSIERPKLVDLFGHGYCSDRNQMLEVSGYRLDEVVLRRLYTEGHAEGKRFSYASLVELAAPFDDGDRFLEEKDLRRAYALLKPVELPPQKGVSTTPAVNRALWQALRDCEPDFESYAVDARPSNAARVILETRGSVGSGEKVYASLYVTGSKPSERLTRLTKKNEIYFELKKFGAPDRLFGPFVVDQLGIRSVAQPEPQSDGVDEGAILRDLGSQVVARQALADGELFAHKYYDFDDVTSAELKTYVELAERQAVRLTTSQRRALEDLTGYKTTGNTNPEVNAHLRDGNRGAHPTVRLLDDAFNAGVELPKGMLLFRGASGGVRQGTLRTDAAYLCTSLEPSIAKMFADKGSRRKTMMIIEVGDGVRGLVTGNRTESEILLPRDLPLHVVRSQRSGGYSIVHVRAGDSACSP